jgi:hypothetical protein
MEGTAGKPGCRCESHMTLAPRKPRIAQTAPAASSPGWTPTCQRYPMTRRAAPSSTASSRDGSTATPASSQPKAPRSSRAILTIRRTRPTSCSPSPRSRRDALRLRCRVVQARRPDHLGRRRVIIAAMLWATLLEKLAAPSLNEIRIFPRLLDCDDDCRTGCAATSRGGCSSQPTIRGKEEYPLISALYIWRTRDLLQDPAPPVKLPA